LLRTCITSAPTVDLEAGYSGRDLADVRTIARAIGVIDLLTAAVAEHFGAVILHYDADFEHVAATTGQRHKWIGPRSTLP